jgi:Tripartite tricarboxylate transporter family receptor
MISISRRAFAFGAALGLVAATQSRAQAYPSKPIKVIVPFSPGGPADVMARVAGQRMSAILGQNLFVENRGGAGGTLGARAAAQAEPDGYTLMLANTSTLVIGPAVYRDVGYDPLKSFALIAAFGTTASILVVNPDLPVRSVQELVTLAKRQPGKLSYSSPGIGTPPHLIAALLKLKTGIDLLHVPYKGGGQSVGAVGALRQAARNRLDRRKPQRGDIGHPDDDRGRCPGFRLGLVHRSGRARRHTGRDRGETQCCRERQPQFTRRAHHAHQARRRAAAGLSGRLHGIRDTGDGKVARRGAGGEDQDRVRIVIARRAQCGEAISFYSAEIASLRSQ